MPKVTIKNRIDLKEVDFSYTALNSTNYPYGNIDIKDTVEYYFETGELAASVKVGAIIDWMENNEINDAEEQEVCINDSPFEKQYKSEIQLVKGLSDVEYLDKNFETVTRLFFIETYGRKEVKNAA